MIALRIGLKYLAMQQTCNEAELKVLFGLSPYRELIDSGDHHGKDPMGQPGLNTVLDKPLIYASKLIATESRQIQTDQFALCVTAIVNWLTNNRGGRITRWRSLSSTLTEHQSGFSSISSSFSKISLIVLF